MIEPFQTMSCQHLNPDVASKRADKIIEETADFVSTQYSDVSGD
jgi:hypothetical protein